MRVIAGELGGRRLLTPRGTGTRPTSERIREALFSILGDVADARVLDLFAGSGALGIEALSRGARHTTFVESAPAALSAIERNVDALDLGRRSTVVRSDVLTALRGPLAAPDPYDLVFVDPPYSQAGAIGRLLSQALAGLLAPAARVLSESDRREPLTLDLQMILERRYGDTLIRIYRPEDK
jgi:16S rRNA (guanine966-N2)-methyltransferase